MSDQALLSKLKFDDARSVLIRRILATVLAVAFLAGVAGDLNARFGQALAEDEYIPRSFLLAAGLAATGLGLALVLIWRARWLAPANRLRSRLRWLKWLLVPLPAAAVSYLYLYTKWSQVFGGDYMRGLFWLLALALTAWLVTGRREQLFSWPGLLASGVVMGVIFSGALALQNVVSYPFSLSWSEGNRIWDYSVLYGRRLYDYPAGERIFTYIDKGRQSLWGLPFLLPSVSILGVRLWSALVFSVPYALLGLFVFYSRKMRVGEWLLLGLWTYLFLNQGPIYSPLVLAAILVAYARRSPLLPAVLLVGLAGYYARYSRFTWMFAPGMWAAMVALVDANPHGVKTTLQRWVRTITLGLAGLTGGYILPEILSRIRAASAGVQAAPSVVSAEGLGNLVGRQPLLWDRLWPNPTYHLGIVYGLLLAAGPLLALLVYLAVTRRWRLDIFQKLALAGVLSTFLGVGIVVSVKIGGGSNLHNVDMFLIGLLFAAGLAWQSGGREWVLEGHKGWLAGLLLLAAVFYPASQGILTARPNVRPDAAMAGDALEQVRQAVERNRGEGEILFLDQRQLLTFGEVPQVPLVADYEKKYLMDQAMSEDAGYFEGFYEDLAAHRFSLIVTEPLQTHYQGDTYQFGNENDAWVKWVSIPLLCYYEPVETNMRVGVQLLEPKQKSAPEPGLVCPPY